MTDRPYCCEVGPKGYMCTEDEGHAGPHEARGESGEWCESWSAAPLDPPDRYTYRPEGMSDTEWAERLAAPAPQDGPPWESWNAETLPALHHSVGTDGASLFIDNQTGRDLTATIGGGRLTITEAPAPQDGKPRSCDGSHSCAAETHIPGCYRSTPCHCPPSAPDLPPGVTRCTAADGTVFDVALGRDVPDGWVGGLDAATIRQHHPNGPHIVRPPERPAEPRTERVPVGSLRGRHLPGVSRPIDRYWADDCALNEVNVSCGGIHYAIPIDPEGYVFVLALADTDGEAPQ